MRAAQFLTPGEPSVIKTRRIPRPQCCEMTQVLIKVGTGGLNPIDFKNATQSVRQYHEILAHRLWL